MSDIVLPETIYEFDSYTVTPDTNAEDPSALRFSVAGAGLPVSFVDNMDGSFAMNTGVGTELDFPAYYAVTATDGCSVATATISLQSFAEKAAFVSILNLTGSNYDVVVGSMPTGADEMIYEEYDFVADYDLESGQNVKASDSVSVWVFDSFTSGPVDERDEEDFFGRVDGLNFELDKEYLLVIAKNDAGEFTADAIELVEPAMEETFVLSVSHYGLGADPVDILNLDTAEVLVDDLAYGVTSPSLELPVAPAYNLGLDVDQDGVSDFDIALEEEAFLPGDRVNVSAYFKAGVMNLSISGIDAEMDSFFDEFETTILAPPPEPTTLDEILANLPYSSGDYAPNETGGLYDQSTLQIQAPEGTTSITITFDYAFEVFFGSNYDFLVVKDADGNQIEAGVDADGNVVNVETRSTRTGFGGVVTGLTVEVPGSYALIGVAADGSGQDAGYTITAISAQ